MPDSIVVVGATAAAAAAGAIRYAANILIMPVAPVAPVPPVAPVSPGVMSQRFSNQLLINALFIVY